MKIFISIAVIVVIIALYWKGAQRARHTLEARFAERPNVEFEAFYEKYYRGRIEKSLLCELLNHVAQELSIPSTKLLPTDRFDNELMPARGWEFDAGNKTLLVELGQLAKKKQAVFNVKDIATLDDYLMAMASVY